MSCRFEASEAVKHVSFGAVREFVYVRCVEFRLQVSVHADLGIGGCGDL